MIVKTGRFGQLTIQAEELIKIPSGIMGFPELTEFCLVDPNDDTLILWLQSTQNASFALPVLEPKIFMPTYAARLSAAELRELKLDNVNQSAVFTILTIPADVTQMSANLKAPIVINLKEQIARQVVLQENEYGIKHAMFKELRMHLVTLRSNKSVTDQDAARVAGSPVSIKSIPPSLTVKSLQANA